MIDKVLISFKKLKYREKILVVAFIAFIGFNVYSQTIYKPLSRGIKRYKGQSERFRSRLKGLKAKIPSLDKQKGKTAMLDEECENLLSQIGRIRSALPATGNIAQLLAEFSRQAKEKVKLLSLRKKIEINDNYSRIFIEVEFNAVYKEVINYIKRLESISPFLKIEEIELSNSSSGNKEVSGRMIFSSLLTNFSSVEQLIAKDVLEITSDTRDIFISKSKNFIKEKKKELKLEGITYNAEKSTAIINGEVVKIGSQIGNFKIIQILPEGVILTDDAEECTLEIER
ncbi:MAG: type 4a pilus biogenesis protein PilO [Candidatus Omnitrophica bacterium]|nr:type 4a pilus biogenesis protein PilO [Candidatus Omnitrophota bacterium]